MASSLARLQHYWDAELAEELEEDSAEISANYMSNDRIENHKLVPSPILSMHDSQLPSGQRPILWESLRWLPLGQVPASTTAESKCALITQLIEPSRKQIFKA